MSLNLTNYIGRVAEWSIATVSKTVSNFWTREFKSHPFRIIVEPKAFYVSGKEGPLLEDEMESAKKLAKKIKEELDKLFVRVFSSFFRRVFENNFLV